MYVHAERRRLDELPGEQRHVDAQHRVGTCGGEQLVGSQVDREVSGVGLVQIEHIHAVELHAEIVQLRIGRAVDPVAHRAVRDDGHDVGRERSARALWANEPRPHDHVRTGLSRPEPIGRKRQVHELARAVEDGAEVGDRPRQLEDLRAGLAPTAEVVIEHERAASPEVAGRPAAQHEIVGTVARTAGQAARHPERGISDRDLEISLLGCLLLDLVRDHGLPARAADASAASARAAVATGATAALRADGPLAARTAAIRVATAAGAGGRRSDRHGQGHEPSRSLHASQATSRRSSRQRPLPPYPPPVRWTTSTTSPSSISAEA